MATSQKLTEHFLTCPVCLEVFTDPSTLACDHTFCGRCVVSYTKTRPDAVKAKSLPCPFCKRLTKVPDPDRPVEEWPSQMKPSLLLRGLIDSFGPGSKDTTNCNLCHEEGETNPASAWCSVCDVSLCEACHKAHRRNPASRHHDVSNLSGEVKVKRRRRIMCQEHTDQCITFYCKDCKKTLCQSCCIIYHRQCKSITSLESMIPGMTAILEARKKSLGKKIQEEEKKMDTRKSQCDDMKQNKSSIQSQIRSTAQKVMESIKRKEKQLIDELDEVTDKQMGQLKADIKSGDMAIQIYKQQVEFINQALNSDCEVDMFNLNQSSESWDVQPVENTGGNKSRNKIEFSHDMDKITKTLDDLSLGKIRLIQKGALDTLSTLVLTYTIDFKMNTDRSTPKLYDVTHMNVNGADTLIVTDFKNQCIKAFYSRNKDQSRFSRLQLQSGPRCIAWLQDKNIAVSLPDSRQIVTIKVTPDLSLLSSITTGKQYYGLAALTPTTMAAGSWSPPWVDILDRSGAVLKFISPLNNGQQIMKNPNLLCTTMKGNILVSDSGSKSALCLTPQGDVVFNYHPTGDTALKYPTGITSTGTGDILVADYTGQKVIQLSESGQFVRDLLTSRDGLGLPYGLAYDERGSIYVTHDSGFVRVFTFK